MWDMAALEGHNKDKNVIVWIIGKLPLDSAVVQHL